MQTLENNVKNVWGEKGKIWLNQLPTVIALLSKHWTLKKITPVTNMSYNYVARACQNSHTPVVLKISCSKHIIEDEYKALKHFKGHGAIKLIDIHKTHNAMLLEQAIPGYHLNTHRFATNNIIDTINIYKKVVEKLASQSMSSNKHLHVRTWCQAIDRIQDQRIDKCFIKKAKELRAFLLESAKHEYLCHGDLHLENIIQHQKQWVAIDPKGVIGEMAFEAAAFDLINKHEWDDISTIQDKIINRVAWLASALNIDKNRLLAWVFLRALISAQWFIEDNGDPTKMLQVAANVYSQ